MENDYVILATLEEEERKFQFKKKLALKWVDQHKTWVSAIIIQLNKDGYEVKDFDASNIHFDNFNSDGLLQLKGRALLNIELSEKATYKKIENCLKKRSVEDFFMPELVSRYIPEKGRNTRRTNYVPGHWIYEGTSSTIRITLYYDQK